MLVKWLQKMEGTGAKKMDAICRISLNTSNRWSSRKLRSFNTCYLYFADVRNEAPSIAECKFNSSSISSVFSDWKKCEDFRTIIAERVMRSRACKGLFSRQRKAAICVGYEISVGRIRSVELKNFFFFQSKYFFHLEE